MSILIHLGIAAIGLIYPIYVFKTLGACYFEESKKKEEKPKSVRIDKTV